MRAMELGDGADQAQAKAVARRRAAAFPSIEAVSQTWARSMLATPGPLSSTARIAPVVLTGATVKADIDVGSRRACGAMHSPPC